MAEQNFRTPEEAAAAGWPGHTQEDVDRDAITVRELVEQEMADPTSPVTPEGQVDFTWPEHPLQEDERTVQDGEAW